MSAFWSYLYKYASLSLSALVLCSGIFLILCLIVRRRSALSVRRQVLWFVSLWYLIALSLIIFSTGNDSGSDVNLSPLRSIYAAIVDTGISLWQLVALTAGLFIPFGFLSSLLISRSRLRYFIPLAALVYSMAIELIQIPFGGTFDIDRSLLACIGATFGCGIAMFAFPHRCKSRGCIWKYLCAVVPAALTAALLISYSARPFGYLSCETGKPYNAKRASVDCSQIADELPKKLDLYTLVTASAKPDSMADKIFSALGAERSSGYKSEYDSVKLYQSVDGQILLWYYNDGSFNLTLYSGGPDAGGDPFDFAEGLLKSIGVAVPAGMERETVADGEYRLTADFLSGGGAVYNGSVNFSVRGGRLEYLDYELYTVLPLGSEYAIDADALADRIRHGEFICTGGVMISGDIEDVQCRTVGIVYAGDSKNYYRPMYSIEAAINGGIATILLPAF